MNPAVFKRSYRQWDDFFWDVAKRAALLSKDPGRKVGAVVVSPDRRRNSFGFNGFPEDLPDDPVLLADREYKRAHMIHAERNCLSQAPFDVTGGTLYVTRHPCAHCAEMIARFKVARVVSPHPDLNHPRWGDSWMMATRILGEADITLDWRKE